MVVDMRTDRMIRRTTMVATATAAYFLLTADYGPQENALTPIKMGLKSVESSVKKFIFGPDKDVGEPSSQLKTPEERDKAKLK